jgi:hypothetical protein
MLRSALITIVVTVTSSSAFSSQRPLKVFATASATVVLVVLATMLPEGPLIEALAGPLAAVLVVSADALTNLAFGMRHEGMDVSYIPPMPPWPWSA